MLRKMETSVEAIYDEVDPYIRLFIRLFIIWMFLRLFRLIGMSGTFLDWIEHAEMAVAEITIGVFLLDNLVGLFVTAYERRVAGRPLREKE
jgi:hypothetical protein